MKKFLLSGMVIVALTGCASASVVSIDPVQGKAMHGKSVAHVRHEVVPKIMTLKASGVALGLIAQALQWNQASDMVQGLGIGDPAVEIGNGLMAALQTGRGTVAAAGMLQVQTSDPAELAAAAKGNADYLLDVQTMGWMLGYFPLDWVHYRLVYEANVRLIDVASKGVVAQGKCKFQPESNVGAPSWDQLAENNGVILKNQVALAVQECVATLKTSLAI